MKQNNKLPRGVFMRGGHYWIRYKDQRSKIHREHVGPFLTPAKDAVEKRRSEVRSGTFFPEKVKARALLFGEIAKDYLKLAKARKRSWRDDEDHLEAVKEALNDVPIADLSPARLEGVLSELAEDREWAPATFNRHRSTVSGVFRCAIHAAKAQNEPRAGNQEAR